MGVAIDMDIDSDNMAVSTNFGAPFKATQGKCWALLAVFWTFRPLEPRGGSQSNPTSRSRDYSWLSDLNRACWEDWASLAEALMAYKSFLWVAAKLLCFSWHERNIHLATGSLKYGCLI